MNKLNILSLFGSTLVVAILGLTGATPAMAAVEANGLFELEGNAVDDSSDSPPDDWATLYTGGGGATYFTGINVDPPAGQPHRIFAGGNKDIQDVSEWGWVEGSVPDKSDITDAYAAAYNAAGDLIVYFGADRISNVGDTYLGFWFFKSEVTRNALGGFDGEHTNGDVLVLVNFPQGTKAQPLIQVVEWNSTCVRAGVPSDVCVAENLELVTGAEGAGAVCGPGGDDDVCAITNKENGPYDPTTSPWPYTSKDGSVNEFPYETFFEGGINLTALIGGDNCFSSFMAESRASSSFTAQLKDFILDDFELCGISVTKNCANPRLNAAEDRIIYDITGTIENTGFGTVYNVAVSDVPAFDTDSLVYDPSATSSLASGASIGYSATITVLLTENGPTDVVTATANSKSDNTGTSLNETAEAECPTLQINPALSITKGCETRLDVIGDPARVVAEVTFTGQICNTGDSKLTNVTVTDSHAGTVVSGLTLPKASSDYENDCYTFTGSYYPTEAKAPNPDPEGEPPFVDTDDPTAVRFTDTVTASATDVFGDPLDPEPTASATCPLCPTCPDCEPAP